ncbi:LysR family transcriptional regulator [Asticcacaulis sp. 201]|uniref:LysR family transcriptional regulator n=1 Tax=Asticcacaulis sp. 201 TaxID=3028787 RepID=UPI0029167B77|nr:LysR family transcriptional regulator [Asticcacaulis sp. 201]MDV6330725.1 LysR family transcriptional regulator [Asticcacaulis sp. 201]
MSNPGTPTFDQLQVLLCVVEAGSFAAAARRLNRATSAITYAIDNLEGQLGVSLFDRIGTRKPELTAAGKAVLSEARTVTHGVDILRARVKSLREGQEAEVSIAVDVMLPTARLVDALQAFQASFPIIPLRLHVEALGAIAQLVVAKSAVVGISGPLNTSIEGLDRRHIGTVRLIPVAAPFHPLGRKGRKSPGEARNHIQLVLTDRSPITAGQDFGVIGLKTWRLADLGSKHALLLAGVGWGSMPEFMVRGDIEAGRLVALDLPDWHVNLYDMHAIWRTDTPPGPAAQWLIDRFAQQI